MIRTWLFALALLLASCGQQPQEVEAEPCLRCEKPDPDGCVGGTCPAPTPTWEQTAGPVGTDRATALHVHGDSLLLATWEAMLLSRDGGATWEEAAGLPQGAVTQMVATDEAIFAVVDYARLFRSEDGGGAWAEVRAPGSLVSLAAEGALLFAVVYELESGRLAALRTDDGGATWSHLAPLGPGGEAPYRLFAGDGVLLAPSYETLVLYRSTDAGRSWEPLQAGYEVASADALGYHEGSFFAVSQQTRSIYRSVDGERWTALGVGTDEAISYQSSWLVGTPQGLFAALGAGFVYRWDRTLDGWVQADAGLGPGYLSGFHGGPAGVFALVEDRLLRFHQATGRWQGVAGDLVRTRIEALAGEAGLLLARDAHGRLHASPDAGASWRRLPSPGAGAPAITAAVAFDGSAWVATAGGGLYRSVDGGRHFEQALGGFPAFQGNGGQQYREVAALAVHEGRIFAATGSGWERTDDPWQPVQVTGAGVWVSDDGGRAWSPAREGLPSFAAGAERRWEPLVALASVEGALFASAQYEGLYRSQDGGASWEPVGTGIPRLVGDAPSPAVELAGVAGKVFARAGPTGAAETLYRSTDGGLRFTRYAPAGYEGAALLAVAGGGGEVATAWRRADGSHAILRSTDGAGWEELGSAPVQRLLWLEGCWFGGTSGAGVWRLAGGGGCGFPH